MAIGADLEIQNDKDIRETGGTDNYTVLELHEWLRGLADDATASPDDYMDITRDTPSDKAFETIINLINGYNIDDTVAQRLYEGSIIQTDGDEIYDGIQVLAPEGMHLEIMQDGALITTNFWTSCLNSDPDNGISHQFLTKVRTSGSDIDGRRLIGTTREWGKTYLEYKVNGTARGVNVMAFTGWTDDLNNTSASATAAGWSSITNKSACYVALDVNNDGTNEYYYSEWDKDTYSINQFYERMKYLTIRGTSGSLYGIGAEKFRGITHQVSVSALAGTFDDYEDVSWADGTGQMFANDSPAAACTLWMQVLTGVAPTAGCTITAGSTGATAEVASTPTDRTVSTPFAGQSTGTAIVGAYGFGLEVLDLSDTDKLFDLTNTQRQAPNYVTFTVGGPLVSTEDYVNVAPLGYKFQYDGELGGPFTVDETINFESPSATACLIDLVDNGTIGWMTIRFSEGDLPVDDIAFVGQSSTASAIVNGAVNPTIDVAQFSLSGNASWSGTTCLIVQEPIPTDTPSSGKIRVQHDNGLYTLHPYTSWTASSQEFVITSHDFSTNNASDGNNIYCAYIDVLADATTEAYTAVYDADRSLFIRVRDGGATPIKTFESTGSSTGGAATAVRTSDA